ncbi:MAG: hypothetical protein ACOYK6_07890 [Chthoniobacterales bacterium]
MSTLSKFFLWMFLSLGFIAFLTAQESTTVSATPPAAEVSGDKVSSSPAVPVESPVESGNSTNTKDGSSSSTQGDISPETSSSASVAPSPETAPTASPETSSSVVPTDPSMIPPPQEVSSHPESDTTAPAANETEQQSSPPVLPSTESIEKKKQELKVRYYEVRTQVEKEVDVSALKEKANHATTDEEKRQALRAYYALLFAKMKKVDPSISERCDLLEKAYLHRLEQVVIQPTVPLEPPPTIDKEKK